MQNPSSNPAQCALVALEIEWEQSGVRARSTEEEWTTFRPGELESLQLSRTLERKRRLFAKARQIHRVHLEIRGRGEKIRLQAVAPSADLLDGLPSLAIGGAEVGIRHLLSLARATVALGARVVEWNRQATHDLMQIPTSPLNEAWVQVGAYYGPVNAHIARVALEGEGIVALIQDENTIAVDPLQAIALGGVKVLVRESDVERAVEILQR